jgi:hypothetical protein
MLADPTADFALLGSLPTDAGIEQVSVDVHH